MKNSAKNPSRAYRLSNALSPDLQYYRISILPSSVDKVHANIKSGHDEFMLFEIGKIHDKKLGFNDENLPIEKTFIDGVYANKNLKLARRFTKVRKIAERLMKDLSVEVDFVKIAESDATFQRHLMQNAALGLWRRTATIWGLLASWLSLPTQLQIARLHGGVFY